MRMTPVLFDSDATTYTTQGLGSLKDAVTCKVSEEINGPYELEMTYPVTGRRYASLKNRCIIYCKPGPARAPQPFRIYRITKPLNGIITVYARHISYDLAGIPVDPYTANSALTAMQGLQSHAAVVCPFAFSTTLTDNTDFAVTVPTGIRKVLGDGNASVLGVFGGEFEWDGFTVYLRSRRGQDNGVRIAYGKNLTNIEQDENIANLVTGVIGYWTNSDGVVVQGPVVNAPGNYSYNNIDTVDFSSDFSEQPTPEQLQQATQTYITKNNVGVPEVSISVSWLQLEQYAGYEDTATRERVSLGDTVTVSFPQLSVDAAARVVKTVYDVLLDQYETCDMGSVKPNIAATIAGQQQEISALPSTSTVEQIADMIAQTILGVKGGAVRLLDTNGDGYPDTLYIADNPDPNAAVKVWRFNYEGWGASQNGYNGPFEMSAALGVGMYGQFIVAGVINAALVKVINIDATNITTGTISSTNGALTINLNSAEIEAGTGSTVKVGSSSNYTQFLWQGFNSYVGGELRSGIENSWMWYNRSLTAIFSTSGLTGVGYKNAAGSLQVGYAYDPYSDIQSGFVNYLNGATYCNDTIKADILRVAGGGQLYLENNIAGYSDATVTTYYNEVRINNLGLYVYGDFGCSGSKNRIVATKTYGTRALNAMESAAALFCDSGSGRLDESGQCLLTIHPVLDECLDPNAVPQWLVTGAAPGFWVQKCGRIAFVHGPAWAEFDWMLIAPQKGYADCYADPVPAAPPVPDGPGESELDAVSKQTERRIQELDALTDAVAAGWAELEEMEESA